MNKSLLILLLFLSKNVLSQVTDSFTDGNFTNNPAWSGSNAANDFVIVSGQLRSNSTVTNSSFYLSTPSTLAINCSWEFWCNLKFNTSGPNTVDVYLISDKADLQSADINGYFVRLGTSDDEISLYKRTGNTSSSVKIIDGVNGTLNTSNNTVKIKVTRSADKFTLERDLTGTGGSFFKEGEVDGNSIQTSSHFGIFIHQSTASFVQKHFFDDITIQNLIVDNTLPKLISAQAIDSLTVEATFDEAIDSVTAKVSSNYSLSPSVGSFIAETTPDAKIYRLRFAAGLQTSLYTLSVTGIKDLSGNAIGGNNTAGFHFAKPYIAKKNDIMINEIFADPSPQIDLSAAEFIELWNTTNETIKLKNWKYSDASTTFIFAGDSLKPNELIILCPKADTAEFKQFGRVIGVSPWPSLNNAGDDLKLLNEYGTVISQVNYTDSWYKHSTKKSGGWTLERIDPLSKCEGLAAWEASTDSSGGTPGKINSVYFKDHDLLALKADSLHKTSDSTLLVYFNKPLDEATVSASNFNPMPASGNISLSISENLRQVKLAFSQKFGPGTTYSLSIQSLSDCSGNVFSGPALTFSTPALPPPPPVRADTAKIFITEIFADPSPDVGLPLAEFVEIYNPGEDTVDLEGWSLNDPSTKAILKKAVILPGEYLILCPAADTTQYRSFGKTLGLSPWPSLNNASDQIVLKSFKNRIVDSVAYADGWYKNSTKKSGGWTLERIDPLSKCEGLAAWEASTDSSGGTPGKINSVYFKDHDLLALKADSLHKTSDSTLLVYFNKPLDEATVSASNFSLMPASGNISLSISENLRQVKLAFGQKFGPGTTYSLSIQSLSDCSGNVISGPALIFSTPALPPPPPVRADTAKIFVTEIFADPSPEVGLPLAEFVEIYNPGKDTVDLEGWSLSDPSTKAILKKAVILPGEYLILCPAADTTQYRSFGKTLGLSPWPSLNNASDQIVLKSFKNRIVDSVAYADGWYKNSTKKSGGWTLERIDPLSKCEGLAAWEASTGTSGGTPGKVNSVYFKDYDLLALKADSLHKTSDSTLLVYFNKPLDEATVSASNFNLMPASGTISLSVSENLRQVKLAFDQKFGPGTTYSLSIQSLSDCSGNVISGPALTFSTPALPPPPPVRADTAKIFITEIFADPSPEVGLPLAEFVEIYNPGKDTVDLDGWSLSDPSTKAILKKAIILPGEYLILCPAADTTRYRSFGKTLGLSPWPSLNNPADQIVLKSFKNRAVDSVGYNDTWYKDAVKKSGGWSLELIDHNAICTGKQNWMASKDASGGTPGKQNSVFKSHPGTEPLKLLNAVLTDSITIRLTFNRSLDSVTAVQPSNYSLNNGVGSPAKIQSEDYQQIKLVFPKTIARGNTYRITASNVSDCMGSVISPANNTAEFFYPDRINTGDIVISEILFNPRAGGVDFVEIYNRSGNNLDLQELQLATAKNDSLISVKPLSSSPLIIEPGKYFVLTTDPGNIQNEYKTETTSNFLKMATLPAFNDDAGVAVLISGRNRIDQLNYDAKMHFKLIKDPEGVSLERSSLNRPANEPGNFRSAAASAGYATPGYKNSQFMEAVSFEKEVFLASQTFSPDNDGFEDVLELKYKLPEPGWVANATVYTDKGILIKKIASNITLAAEGVISWDGLNESNQQLPVGIYVLHLEVFNARGQVKKYRRTFVLAARLN